MERQDYYHHVLKPFQQLVLLPCPAANLLNLTLGCNFFVDLMDVEMLTVSGAAPQLQSSSDILLSSHGMICHFCINIHIGCSAPQTVQTVVIHSLFDPKIDLGWQETGHQENVIQQPESAAITTPSKPKSPLAISNQRVHKNNQPSS